jgi:pectinesterase
MAGRTLEVGPGRAFASLGRALAAAAPGDSVRLAPGVYYEKIRIETPGIAVYGGGRASVVWDDSARRPLAGGEPMGTFNSYTVYVGAPGVVLDGLAVVNAAGPGRKAGQAVALYADADRLTVRRCRLTARQDTLCTGPLPHNPLPKGVNLVHPVAGLDPAVEPILPFRQLYVDCVISGDVDFIFGSALARFERCRIRPLPRPDGPAWVAAPSTYPGQSAGFVFADCVFGGGGGRRPPYAYLARPWRHTGRCAFLGCYLGREFAAAGWDDWGKPEAHREAGFAAWACRGPGSRPEAWPAWVARGPLVPAGFERADLFGGWTPPTERRLLSGDRAGAAFPCRPRPGRCRPGR